MRGRAPAYGVLAAAGAAALIVLVLGLITVGVLGGGASTAAPPNRTATTETTATGATESATTETTATQTTATTTAIPATPGASQLPTATGVSTPPGTDWPTPWLEVLRALDAQRSSAFSKLDAAALDSVYVRESVPWKADNNLLTTYRNQHLRIEDLKLEIRSLVIEREDTTRAVLQVVDRLASGTAVDQSGQRTTFPPGNPTARRITLDSTTPGTWRISKITTLHQ